MIFSPTTFRDLWILDVEPRSDSRGLFARTVCVEELEKYSLNSRFVQQSVSWNPIVGTLRGLHSQAHPHAEDKLVRVTRGAIFDVVVDDRRESETYGQSFSVELSAENRRQLYIPKGFLHGFQALKENTEVLYQMTAPFVPEASSGIRFDDPKLSIKWPISIEFGDQLRISEDDRNLPYWEP